MCSAGGQRRSWLIHNEHPQSGIEEYPSDLDHLAVRQAQSPRFESGADPILRENRVKSSLDRSLGFSTPANPAKSRREFQEDIFADRQISTEREFLMDDSNP